MADNTEQPLDNPEPSTQQQISELRGEVHTLSNAMTTFFARFPVDPPHSDHHDPPPHHNPQPPRNPILNLIPNQQPLNSTITEHHPSANQQVPHPFPPTNPPAFPVLYSEHQKLPEVWFSGESSQLGPFLKDIHNFFHL
ncbi:hypothetical protein PSTG_13906 [Puccinia striiformis f. sp. tritici PST-78]|uniref:Uncharacterized protein n=1 Tax=Puccinia striiformis f. sp. tritici PST-78 TaxID=1165861 RepID=A0A0L0V0H8_9BASI|nr:hypothetical protein PSTG_13906 [Puccinia striiformis f. sp. tritici PST-78]